MRRASLLAWLAAVALLPHTLAQAPAQREIHLGDASLSVLIPDGFAATTPLTDWVERCARIVSRYYGRFPVSQVRIVLIPTAGTEVSGGTTYGQPQPLIRVRVGTAVTPTALLSDWVLVHEMTHLALPDVGEAQAWLSEGLAVYIEGVARVQAGNRTVEDVFSEAHRSMPRGLPGPNGRGLDQDHTWGRTYWGGALFCLLADVQIHERTHNRLGLQDAMRAVLRASGGLTATWDIQRILATADTATGVPVLTQLYSAMKDQPVAPDLTDLWDSLGVEAISDGVRLSEAAPLASVRRAIFTPR